jgi:tRNA-specific 2-thiouridylase
VKGKLTAAQLAAKKIVVGLSGGSNSAVTAALLKSQGYLVHGVYLQTVDPKTGHNKEFASRCCLTKSEESAREVSRKLDIPFHAVNVAERFDDRVVDGFVHDLLQTRLPNPCIPCNVDIRMGSLMAKADELGCDKVATGHHAQVVRDAASPQGGEGVARLTRAVNVQKDQSYFLFGLSQSQLARLIFPLGGFHDTMVERLAREFDLPDSSPGSPQAICLSQDQKYVPFLEARVAPALRLPGSIRMVDGSVLGEHTGLFPYRIGQKVKLAPHVKEQDKYQVTGFDVTGHALIIGYEPDRTHSELRASRATWIRRVDGLHGLRTTARFYPSQKDALPCRVTHFENATVRIELEKPCRDLAVGQAVVFYDGDEVLGGAFVDRLGDLGSR